MLSGEAANIYLSANCAPLFADLFLYSYEAEFIQGFLKKNERKLAIFFNLTFRYIDDVLSLNNCKFGDFVDHIYPMELEIKDTIDTDRSVSSLDLHLEIDNEGRLRSNLTTKEMMSIFPLWTFLLYVATFQWHLHMEYISLIWSDIPELVIPIMISVIETYHRVCNKSNTTGVTYGTGTAYMFSGFRVVRSLVFCAMFCRSLFLLLSLFFWPLCCLFLFDLRLLITPLVSFGHCVVCSCSTCGFSLPLWYLLAIVLSVLARLTASHYPFGIFWPLCCLFLLDLRLLITPLVYFGHCVVCSCWTCGFSLPLWYLLAIVLSVLVELAASHYLFGIFKPFLLSLDYPIVSRAHDILHLRRAR